MTKNTKTSYCLCKKCHNEIPLDTHKVLTYCSCKSIYVDGCADYFRIGGNKEDFKLIEKN